MSRPILIAFWTNASAKIAKASAKAPFRHLYEGRGEPIDLRHFHNRFGWRARGGLVCTGVLYRTEAFMTGLSTARIGSKAAQTAHIEHTAPINTLLAHFRARTLASETETMARLLAHSVTTAMTDGQGAERLSMVRPGQNHRTDALTEHQADYDHPFQRYVPTAAPRSGTRSGGRSGALHLCRALRKHHGSARLGGAGRLGARGRRITTLIVVRRV